jgi:transcriptional regulator with GAF, ATPase, and Fis domain
MICEDVVRELAFDRKSISIGNGPFNDIVFAKCAIAGIHGELEVHEDGTLAFRARASSMPTRVFRGDDLTQSSDGVEEQTLHVRPGDVICLGASPAVKLEIVGMESEREATWSTHRIDSDAAGAMSRDAGRLFFRLSDELSQTPSIEHFLRVAARLVHECTGRVPQRVELAIPIESSPWRSDDHRLDQISIDRTGVDIEESPAAAVSEEAVSGNYRRTRDPLPPFRARTSEILHELEKLDHFVWLQPQQGSAQLLIPCSLRDELAAVLGLQFGEYERESHSEAVSRVATLLRPLAAVALDSKRQMRRVEGVVEENRYWRERQRRHHLYKDLIAESEAAREVYENLNVCVEHDKPVLLLGEAGSGKALVARAMHHLSSRKDAMLTSINCRGLSGDELDFELFGSVNNELTGDIEARKGIFELADGGTVFLEEIDQLSLMIQGKVLRMLRESEVRRIGEAVGRRVDVRLLTSTHCDLRALVDSGRFRRDLYLVLCEHRLKLPPLRERREDILPLARTFLRNFSARYARPCRRISPEVESILLAHSWQGNVRELQSVMEAAVLQCNDESIEIGHLGL